MLSEAVEAAVGEAPVLSEAIGESESVKTDAGDSNASNTDKTYTDSDIKDLQKDIFGDDLTPQKKTRKPNAKPALKKTKKPKEQSDNLQNTRKAKEKSAERHPEQVMKLRSRK